MLPLGRERIQKDGVVEDDEESADEFARKILIPDNEFEEFCKQVNFTRNSIFHFASKVAIHPGILVGRLQKDRYVIFSKFNSLKERYELLLQ